MSKVIKLEVAYVEKRKTLKKEFEIAIVPNRFNVDYGEYIGKSKEVLLLNSKYQKATTDEELKEIEAQLVGLDLRAILQMKYNLIKSIMIANDYIEEYDEEWWDLRVDPNDIESFITQCAMKDNDADEGSKKKVLSLLGL